MYWTEGQGKPGVQSGVLVLLGIAWSKNLLSYIYVVFWFGEYGDTCINLWAVHETMLFTLSNTTLAIYSDPWG